MKKRSTKQECFMFHRIGCETVKQNQNRETGDETCMKQAH